jgi:hypothetical protein
VEGLLAHRDAVERRFELERGDIADEEADA